MATVSYTWERDEYQTVYLIIEYSYSKPVPASYLSPPEGGLELEGITATAILYNDEDGEPVDHAATKDELQEAEEAFPFDKAWDVIREDYYE